jgi:hypothetical protein
VSSAKSFAKLVHKYIPQESACHPPGCGSGNKQFCSHASILGIFAYMQVGQTALLHLAQNLYNEPAANADFQANGFKEHRSMIKKLRKQRHQKKKRQKLIWTIGAGALLILSVVFPLLKNANRINPELVEVEGRPAVKVDQELIDYGYKKWDTNLTFDIKVTNVGDQTLRFSETPYVEVLEGC